MSDIILKSKFEIDDSRVRSRKDPESQMHMLNSSPTDRQPLNTDESDDHSPRGHVLKKSDKTERMYYADWLRAFAIQFVIFVHVDQLCMEATDISNPKTFERVPHN
jgi:hypothetical protein